MKMIFTKYFLLVTFCFTSPTSFTEEIARAFELRNVQPSFQTHQTVIHSLKTKLKIQQQAEESPNSKLIKPVDSTRTQSQKIFQKTEEVSTTTALISFYTVWEVTFIHEDVAYSGSGFFIEPNKFVTAFHVVDSAIQNDTINKINLTRSNDSKTIKIKKVLALSVTKDLALLETEESVSDYLPVREQTLDNLPEHLTLLGYPNGKFRIMENISQINNTYDLLYFNVDYANLLGGSGGPIIDSQGHVVAVSSMAFSNYTAVTELRSFISDIETFSCGDRSVKVCLKESLDLLHQRAEDGKASAQYRLGFLYKEKEDPIQAEKWFSLAAEQGHLHAQYELGSVLLSTLILGRSKTIEESSSWFQKAAEAGFTPAQYKLALVMRWQDNIEEALQWFQKVAEAGFAPAQYELAMILKEEGQIEEAVYWMKKAIDTDYTPAQYELAMILKEEGQIEEAVYWMKKAIDTDYTPAQYELAMILAEQGKWETALPLFRKVGEKDDVPNQYASDLYELGLTMKDENQIEVATDLFTMAMNQGHYSAGYELVKLETQKLFRLE